jgi:hypothetical protein
LRYSITSSVRASSMGGISRPSALVHRFHETDHLVGIHVSVDVL